MKLINKLIPITSHDRTLAYTFAESSAEKSVAYYQRRNKETNFEKVLNDVFNGKLGEIAVAKYYRSLNKNVSSPDFLMNANQVHDADLVMDGLNIHIKTCKPKYNSWLAEKNAVKNLGDNDYFVLCVMHDVNNIEIVCAVQAKNIKWKPPIKDMPTKVGIYLNDMHA